MGALGGARKLLVAGERDLIVTDPGLLAFAAVAADTTDPAAGISRLAVAALQMFFNPAGSGVMERARTASMVKAATGLTADASNIWTPAAGKKVRLMGYALTVSSQAIKGVAGPLILLLTDNGSNFATGTGGRTPTHVAFIPGAAGPVGPPLLVAIVNLPGNGLLSTGANNPMLLNLTNGPLTGGTIDVLAWGTEE